MKLARPSKPTKTIFKCSKKRRARKRGRWSFKSCSRRELKSFRIWNKERRHFTLQWLCLLITSICNQGTIWRKASYLSINKLSLDRWKRVASRQITISSLKTRHLRRFGRRVVSDYQKKKSKNELIPKENTIKSAEWSGQLTLIRWKQMQSCKNREFQRQVRF